MGSLTVLRKRLSELLAGPEYALGEVQVDAIGRIMWGLSNGDKKFRPIDVDSSGRIVVSASIDALGRVLVNPGVSGVSPLEQISDSTELPGNTVFIVDAAPAAGQVYDVEWLIAYLVCDGTVATRTLRVDVGTTVAAAAALSADFTLGTTTGVTLTQSEEGAIVIDTEGREWNNDNGTLANVSPSLFPRRLQGDVGARPILITTNAVVGDTKRLIFGYTRRVA